MTVENSFVWKFTFGNSLLLPVCLRLRLEMHIIVVNDICNGPLESTTFRKIQIVDILLLSSFVLTVM